MSGNRKRTGASGNILDQLEPRAGRGTARAGFSIGIEPRWVWAGGGAIVLLVAALASIAWSTTTAAKPRPPVDALATAQAAPAIKPVFETGPAKVQRIALASAGSAPLLLARVEPPPMPPPMPLVVLPREGKAIPAAAGTVRQPAVQKPAAARAGKPAGQRQTARRAPPRSARAKPGPAPQVVQEADTDVALIRAIRKATQAQSE